MSRGKLGAQTAGKICHSKTAAELIKQCKSILHTVVIFTPQFCLQQKKNQNRSKKSRKQKARTSKNSQSIAVQQQQQLSDLTAAAKRESIGFHSYWPCWTQGKAKQKEKEYAHKVEKKRKRKRNTAAVTDQFTTGSDGDANTAPYIQSNSVHKQQRKTTKVVKECKVKSSKVRQRGLGR